MADVPSAELLARFAEDDSTAAEELFARYAQRLAALARTRLSRRLAARIDADDVVQSAYRSFFTLAAGGGIVLQESGDLWRLLVRITLRKVYRSARRHRAERRSVEREEAWPDEAALCSREPTPAQAAALTDELRAVLAPLGPVQRRIIELRLQGNDIDPIAIEVRRSPRTVRRVLAGLGDELRRRLAESGAPVPGPLPDNRELLSYGDVVLVRQLGEGGMGKVYRATLRNSDQPVAVKLLRKPLRQDRRFAARFLEEVRLLRRLRHPGIVSVLGLGRLPDGGHFLVMELVEGSDLARQIRAGPIRVEQALCWVAEAADAIEHAHRQGVVHCDLKPGNLLLDRDGHVRVTDFGLARSLEGGGPAEAGGTEGFMAPEQADAALGPIGPATDVHGLGAVLYALLTGRAPCAGCDRGAYRHTGPSLSQLKARVPGKVAALCRRCLARNPMRRFASAFEVARAIRALDIFPCPS